MLNRELKRKNNYPSNPKGSGKDRKNKTGEGYRDLLTVEYYIYKKKRYYINEYRSRGGGKSDANYTLIGSITEVKLDSGKGEPLGKKLYFRGKE